MANDSGGIVEAVGWGEVEEGHVGCSAEGCPNKCSTGVGVVPDEGGGLIKTCCGSIGYAG